MPGNSSGMFQSLERPVTGRTRVSHRLKSCKSLRRDNEQRLFGVEVRVASAKSVPSILETKRKVRFALAIMTQCLVRHHRPQVRPADADINHVANRLAGVALPLSTAHPVGKVGHLVEHGVHLRNDVFAIYN